MHRLLALLFAVTCASGCTALLKFDDLVAPAGSSDGGVTPPGDAAHDANPDAGADGGAVPETDAGPDGGAVPETDAGPDGGAGPTLSVDPVVGAIFNGESLALSVRDCAAPEWSLEEFCAQMSVTLSQGLLTAPASQLVDGQPCTVSVSCPATGGTGQATIWVLRLIEPLSPSIVVNGVQPNGGRVYVTSSQPGNEFSASVPAPSGSGKSVTLRLHSPQLDMNNAHFLAFQDSPGLGRPHASDPIAASTSLALTLATLSGTAAFPTAVMEASLGGDPGEVLLDFPPLKTKLEELANRTLEAGTSYRFTYTAQSGVEKTVTLDPPLAFLFAALDVDAAKPMKIEANGQALTIAPPPPIPLDAELELHVTSDPGMTLGRVWAFARRTLDGRLFAASSTDPSGKVLVSVQAGFEYEVGAWLDSDSNGLFGFGDASSRVFGTGPLVRATAPSQTVTVRVSNVPFLVQAREVRGSFGISGVEMTVRSNHAKVLSARAFTPTFGTDLGLQDDPVPTFRSRLSNVTTVHAMVTFLEGSVVRTVGVPDIPVFAAPPWDDTQGIESVCSAEGARRITLAVPSSELLYRVTLLGSQGSPLGPEVPLQLPIMLAADWSSAYQLQLVVQKAAPEPHLAWGGYTEARSLNIPAAQDCVPDACSDGLDNNGDGLTDCADTSCAALPQCKVELCNNAADDDSNGLIDCADRGVCLNQPCGSGTSARCDAKGNCAGGETNCSDQLDDDGDHLVDCQDEDCADNPACTAASETCADGRDNDGNGKNRLPGYERLPDLHALHEQRRVLLARAMRRRRKGRGLRQRPGRRLRRPDRLPGQGLHFPALRQRRDLQRHGIPVHGRREELRRRERRRLRRRYRLPGRRLRPEAVWRHQRLRQPNLPIGLTGSSTPVRQDRSSLAHELRGSAKCGLRSDGFTLPKGTQYGRPATPANGGPSATAAESSGRNAGERTRS
ncbi:MAG: hypothetical protein QM765_51400 [Myxococcales bacterium]